MATRSYTLTDREEIILSTLAQKDRQTVEDAFITLVRTSFVAAGIELKYDFERVLPTLYSQLSDTDKIEVEQLIRSRTGA